MNDPFVDEIRQYRDAHAAFSRQTCLVSGGSSTATVCCPNKHSTNR